MTEPVSLKEPLLPRVARASAVAAGAILLLAGIWFGTRYVRVRLALHHAKQEFAAGHFSRSEFWVGRAFGIDGANVEAARLAAALCESQDAPAALRWRMMVVQLAPGDNEARIAWAKAALRFGQPQVAQEALLSLPQDFKDHSAGYHELMAGCALSRHEGDIAEGHFARAAALDPADPVHRVNLAGYQITNSPSPAVRAQAAVWLEDSLRDRRVELAAARALLADALRNRDAARARRFADVIRGLPGRTFNDDLTCLGESRGRDDFRTGLDQLERRVERNPTVAADTGEWLNANGMPGETQRWLRAAPAATGSNVRVQMALAESYVSLGDWTGLSGCLAHAQWGPDGDPLRAAMAIRCKRELGQPWEEDWQKLAREAALHPPSGVVIARLVLGWKWYGQGVDLLWASSGNPSMAEPALDLLWQVYGVTGQTSGLERVARAQLDLEPANASFKNNAAFLSLLLNGASGRAERLAREATEEDPAIPEWAATYAYALLLAGKETDALRAIGRIAGDGLLHNGVRLYRALVLEGTGDHAGARAALDKFSPSDLLPEERKLAAGIVERLGAAAR